MSRECDHFIGFLLSCKSLETKARDEGVKGISQQCGYIAVVLQRWESSGRERERERGNFYISHNTSCFYYFRFFLGGGEAVTADFLT